MDFKNIHIGLLIEQKVDESKIKIARISKFMKLSEAQIKEMYASKSLNSEILMKWCRILKYDFFRIYTQHLILYSPVATIVKKSESQKTALPQFKKNIYTKEIINFIVGLIESKEKTIQQIIKEYKIPKTTLHKWVIKYKTKD